jgi:hypothetical protein
LPEQFLNLDDDQSDSMKDMAGSGPVQHPIDSNPWETILEFVLPAGSGSEVRAMERIFETLDDVIFRPDRLIKLKNALEGAVQKSLEQADESSAGFSIHFRVLVSGIVKARHPSIAEDTVEVVPPGCGFFLVQMTDDTPWVTQTPPTGEGVNHSIWLYIYREGGQAR